MNKVKLNDIDFYYEHINTDDRNDMAKTRGRFKPEEIVELKKIHDYWQNARLKAWSQKYKENKKVETDIFEYLL